MSDSPVAPEPKQRSRIQFPPELPISARVGDIVLALERHQVVIVVGATGSGKTTQLPKVALEMGRGGKRQIGVTQPRRIAATSVAARVASELQVQLGDEVGYQIRFENRTCPNTWVKFMTDGILLAEIQGDRRLDAYDTLIIDEAHERSLTIDFLLGWVKRILPQRPDLKIIVSSATIESERFSEFFDGAPVIQVEGRTFPVDVLYEPPPDDIDLSDAVANAVVNISALDPRGDILVFLPGEREIRESEQELARRNLRHTLVQPLYSRLSAADQAKVFATIPQRRVILATNVAETSLTIPGIVYVVDSGLARLSRYEPRTGTTRLQIEGISQASADQRKGRCGRVRDGICIRLYDEQSFTSRPAFTDPEMKRTGLAGVILRMKSLGLGDVEEFPFLDPPSARSISEGYRVLQELGALDDERNLTRLGHRLAAFPVDPRIARMILAGADQNCLPQILVLAAALNIQDPRERPRGLEQKADQQQRRFRDENSDFLSLLKLWDFLRAQDSSSQLRRACKENFLSFLRVREWREVHRQLQDLVKELRIAPPTRNPKPNQPNDSADAIHRALLSGLLSRVGQWNPEHRIYIGARQTRFALHPSSSLAKKPPAWVMAFELVETSQLFARTAAKIDPAWLAQVGAHLLKRSYSDPHWSEKSARASVREHATLFGLSVLRDHSVDFATISPVRARLMFLEHALVRGEYQSRGAFQANNRKLLEDVARLRDKARQSSMLTNDEHLIEFFDRRVPDSVVNGKTFESWRERAEANQPHLLELSLADVLAHEPDLHPEDYPDSLTFHGVALQAVYRFDPSADDDGITLEIPLPVLPQLSPDQLDGTIPAWRQRKIDALLEQLPRNLRREINPTPELISDLSQRLAATSPDSDNSGNAGQFLSALSRALFETTAVQISPETFRPDAIPAYLRFNFRVLDPRGQPIAESRDLAALQQQHGSQARDAVRRAAPTANVEREAITTWNFADLPLFVTRSVLGAEIRSYPALVDTQNSVAIRLFETQPAADEAHRAGLRRLIQLNLKNQLAAFAKRTPAPFTRRLNAFPPSRAELDTFRDLILARTINEAFALEPNQPNERNQPNQLPRTKAAFDQLLATATPRLAPAFAQIQNTINAIEIELTKTLRALDNVPKQTSGSAAAADIRTQLEHLIPADPTQLADLILHLELPRLEQFPRYLRAAQARLTRAINDPRKDAAKAQPFIPLWQSFLAKRPTALDQTAARRLHLALEELRVALFAPELKPAQPITVATAAQAIQALR
ncbi:MAG: ATP-dependent RNA helicase HrpA [Myxococcota bacterium]